MTFDPDHLRTLHEAATAGQWFVIVNDLIGGTAIANRDVPASQLDTRRTSTDREIGDFCAELDAALIVYLVNHVPDILALADVQAENERLRGRLADARDLLHEFDGRLPNAAAYFAAQTPPAADGGER